MDEEQVSEEQLLAGERSAPDHDHEGVGVTEASLADHLVSGHGMDVPEALSFGALQGLHDRFHGEAHAIDD